MEGFPRPVLLVSRCLEFDNVRYNGQKVSSPIVRDLMQFADMKIVCPEVEIGLGVPRETLRIVRINGEHRLIQTKGGLDFTERMNSFAEKFLDELGEVDGFIFKGLSPSMGLGNVKVYGKAEMSPVVERSSGFFAGHVIDRYHGYPMEESERLLNAHIRHHFLTCLYAFADFRQIKNQGSMDLLMDFHRRNVFLFMSYSPSLLDKMSGLISGTESEIMVFDKYNSLLKKMLRKPGSEVLKIETAKKMFLTFEDKDNNEIFFFENMLRRFSENRISWDAVTEVLRMFSFRTLGEESHKDRFLYPYPEELKAPVDESREKDYWDNEWNKE
ncbi:MAG: hypothetical protein PWQ75_740 [Methanolobus sp.]|jgi:uncharacterized protein YbbK (DUF523 family)/uncharacterized protein YbgA (DUF1722 family)|uniref:YbgA family protein n=1 Tax=Methanolobus sp. TaxID=1874737 RepID=UPI0024AB4D74|nr:DUF523 and DUF1722 domain-containing protein [Methanolobus sp.]MDI3485921.1 hypothetical protein [Methanolobus sp.]MDK2830988.1 hypothetical protein [Methanolobus sp.]